MHTPSLSRRVVLSGVVIVAFVVVVLEVVVFVAVRTELETNIDEVLDTRMAIALGLLEEVPTGEVVDRLTALGVPATVVTADGRVLDADPAIPRFGSGGIPSTLPTPRESEVARVGDVEVTVYATRAGVNAALRQLLLAEIGGTVLAIGGATILLRRGTRRALAPLDEVVGAAVRTAEGARGERLHPDVPSTELGRLATAFDAMLDELEDAVEQARASDARSQQFLADAAHQLRTPVAGIRASVESLLREDDPGTRDRLLGNVVRETGRAARLVSDLLHVARLDRGPDDLRPHDGTVNLTALCEREVARARDLAPHLAVGFTAPTTSDVEVPGDEAAVREALGNLLDNARRHASSAVQIDLTVDGQVVEVLVADDGPGLPDDEVEQAFARFVSLDGRGGSGLGLPIARGVARAHGGDATYRDGTFVLALATATDPAEEDSAVEDA